MSAACLNLKSLIPSFILLLLLLHVPALHGQSQQSRKLGAQLMLGYNVGGQGENRNFVTKSGFEINAGLQYRLTDLVRAGLGVGYMQLSADRFYPIFAEISAALKDRPATPYLVIRFGGSAASNSDIEQYEFYDFDGGIYFTAGWGYLIPLDSKLDLHFELGFQFQQADLEYESRGGEVFEDDIQYYFLGFKTGVSF